ncbi:MAG: hypothetical protein A2015_14560 [Spirochaetes bacterium GWF1_31_7]|nr:MAG: hypothetical protein A2Y30_03195 [Spirochaetes bacterium GWE1_32_154]OHD47862.1 MAG: hypothetical protein A2Y29_17700 [Spirochaetes bacterium GWE2_31_10]OHD50619.1 MAG: hypothetical protein A2015_14560 [Spirochaetes bacterium GWF1_31_7]HBD92715.1 hypothetical protein [Spirochaetia bacterium]HBI36498.1 hypothetical protein [Spirochaetia bacterium]
MEEINTLKVENQSLREIIEVAKQITSDLDIRRITKSINYFVRSKFDAQFCSFVVPSDIDNDKPLEYLYSAGTLNKSILDFDAIDPLIEYFTVLECNQITFKQFSTDFSDQSIINIIGEKGTEFIIPLKSDKGITGIYLQGAKKNGEVYTSDEIQFIVTLLGFVSIALENANLYRRATIDRMTKLYNHHQFQKTLEENIAGYSNSDGIFSLLMFDIDHFKSFNDSFGHLQGDIIIKELARLLLGSVREVDYPARYGGEEFAVILPDTSIQGAYEFAERFRKKIESFDFPGDGIAHKVTISLGVAEFHKKLIKCNEDLISITDKALYHSKETGRNKVSRALYKKKGES